jgi:hypothetical protein
MSVLGVLDVMRRLAVLLIAAIVGACAPSGAPRESADSFSEPAIRSDIARIATLAVSAVANLRDTLVEYRVIQFTSDSLGWVVSVVPQVRAKYADSIDIVGGGGLVRVWRGDSVTVLNRYR